MNTIDITPDMETGDWISTAEAAKILGKSDRTIQEMGKSGRIISRISGRPDQPRARLYDAKDVKRLALANRITRPPQFERKQVAAPSVAPVVSMVLTAQKAESDANRERLKAEREGERTGCFVAVVRGQRENAFHVGES